ncbi:DUF397 domain-containing protein [Streptomyces sp. NPDC001530]|uniref:DUF397 domain-containing protein n=1 Tax=Streptomyces sp. NPDC001530 TaxID=3364582 RepID=UPI0036D0F8A5
MRTHVWQKSSYCQEGEACVHVVATAETVHLTESSDVSRAILSATPDAFAALLHALKSSAPATL